MVGQKKDEISKARQFDAGLLGKTQQVPSQKKANEPFP